jgi:hypothetical protein
MCVSHFRLTSSQLVKLSTIVAVNISEASPSCYCLTKNTTLESIQIIVNWESTYRDMYISIIANLIGSSCSPHLRSVSINLRSVVGEVEHFPWGAMNSLTKVSPCMLQRVEIALQLWIETNLDWSFFEPLAPGEYERYFRQARSALPDLDQKVMIRIVVRHPSHLFANLTSLSSTRSIQDIFDAVSMWHKRDRMIGTLLTLFQSYFDLNPNGLW